MQKVEDNLNSLQVAKQYLSGLQPRQKALQMVNWEDSSIIVWFPHSLTQSLHPYHEPIELDKSRLLQANLHVFPDCYVRLLNAHSNSLQVEIGYRIQLNVAESKLNQLPADWNYRIERLNPTLFITLESETADKFMCLNYMRTLHKHGFKPIGPRWDRYESGMDDKFLIYIPAIRTL
ncbi:hypothetical protein [Paenibacillus psychroresistens]|nr:hypothetical protein [Paenibacillus psychroresistens]